MKDIIISVKRQKKELFIFLICFIIAEIINAIAIIIYDTNWSELFTHIGFAFAIGVTLYALTLAIRILIKLFVRIRKLIKIKRANN